MLPKMTRCQAASLIPPRMREMVLKKRKVRVGSRPQVMSRRHPMVKIGMSALTPRTPSPVSVSSLANTRTLTLSQTLERKSSQHGKSDTRTVLRRTAQRKTPVDHHLQRKSCQPTRHSVMGLDKKHSCLTHALMLGLMTKLSMVSQAGQCDTMICDLLKHCKMQPNHSNPMGPPLDYMAECRVFDGIQSDLYDLCCFYALRTTGDPPEFPMPWELVTCNQVRDLLKSA